MSDGGDGRTRTERSDVITSTTHVRVHVRRRDLPAERHVPGGPLERAVGTVQRSRRSPFESKTSKHNTNRVACWKNRSTENRLRSNNVVPHALPETVFSYRLDSADKVGVTIRANQCESFVSFLFGRFGAKTTGKSGTNETQRRKRTTRHGETDGIGRRTMHYNNTVTRPGRNADGGAAPLPNRPPRKFHDAHPYNILYDVS